MSRNSRCKCGSGLRFKSCCGRIDGPSWNARAIGRVPGSLLDPENRHLIENEPVCKLEGVDLPPGLLVRWLSRDYDWSAIAAGLVRRPVERPAVIVTAGGEEVHPQRITSLVAQGEWEQPVRDMVRRAYRDEIEPFFGRRLRWFEGPQVLRYTAGGYYRPHSDSESWDRESGTWERCLDRHLSLLIYLDNDYSGGQLLFPNFDFRLQPRAGMLVAFPSDHRYLHGAMPVLRGIRHSVVSWSAVEGLELIGREPAPSERPRQAP